MKVIKESLKVDAAYIKESKIKCKENQRKGLPGYPPFYNSRIFRHRHIAYCFLKHEGDSTFTIENIEKPAENNKPNMDMINRYLKEFRLEVSERKTKHEKETVYSGS